MAVLLNKKCLSLDGVPCRKEPIVVDKGRINCVAF